MKSKERIDKGFVLPGYVTDANCYAISYMNVRGDTENKVSKHKDTRFLFLFINKNNFSLFKYFFPYYISSGHKL